MTRADQNTDGARFEFPVKDCHAREISRFRLQYLSAIVPTQVGTLT